MSRSVIAWAAVLLSVCAVTCLAGKGDHHKYEKGAKVRYQGDLCDGNNSTCLVNDLYLLCSSCSSRSKFNQMLCRFHSS